MPLKKFDKCEKTEEFAAKSPTELGFVPLPIPASYSSFANAAISSWSFFSLSLLFFSLRSLNLLREHLVGSLFPKVLLGILLGNNEEEEKKEGKTAFRKKLNQRESAREKVFPPYTVRLLCRAPPRNGESACLLHLTFIIVDSKWNLSLANSPRAQVSNVFAGCVAKTLEIYMQPLSM